jgi:hypothetical protein
MEDNLVEYQLFIKSDKGKWKEWGKPGLNLLEKIEIVEAMNAGANGERTYEGRVIEIVTRTSIVWEG